MYIGLQEENSLLNTVIKILKLLYSVYVQTLYVQSTYKYILNTHFSVKFSCLLYLPTSK